MARGVRSKTSQKRAVRADDMARAFALKLQGWSMRDIAAELGCSLAKAYGLVIEGIRDRPAEGVEQLRQVELDKLDASERRQHEIIAAHLGSAKTGKTVAARMVFAAEATLDRIRARRAKLCGLDAPQRTELTGKDGGPVEIDPVAVAANARSIMRSLFGEVTPDDARPADPQPSGDGSDGAGGVG